ncbi:hypothetical protein AWB68_05008 [Caballeronia choica]|uniref:Helix-turn-helix domain-containing protein n=1 Tax=Caballeronia choica TaxID=326476 RepID=A0A158K7L6_9BURK|nr:helix-turn-helix domain-containing protein [Caballeronia choica]SAL76540.1 hypothetical protein AWB68_05008 [Caballeronia choica]
MSFEALRSVAAMTARLGTALPVAVILADLADRSGCAYPSIPYLCERSGLCRSTVKQALRELRVSGLLVDTGERVGRTGQIPVYRLSLPSYDALRKETGMRNGNGHPEHHDAAASKRAASRPVKDTKRGRRAAPLNGAKGGSFIDGKGAVSLTKIGQPADPGISKGTQENHTGACGITAADGAKVTPASKSAILGSEDSRAEVARMIAILQRKVKP